MRNFLVRALRGLGRGFLAVLNLLWDILQEVGRGVGRLLFLVLEGIGRGLADFLRRLAPWVAGGALAIGIFKYQPELAEAGLTIIIMMAGIWLMVRGAFGRKKKS